MGHLLGYARVSTLEQSPDLQTDALSAAGCEAIHVDHASGAVTARPELDAVRSRLLAGDELVVWRLDRLGRSLRHLLDVVAELQERGVGLRSLHEGIDTTTPTGRLAFAMFGAIAEFERDLLRERTQAGLQAARARGRTGGRRRSLTGEQVAAARNLLASGSDQTVSSVARTLSVNRSTLSRSLKEAEA